MLIESTEFRHCLSHFAKGVTIVTAKNSLGESTSITVDSFNSVSLSPPLILFSVNNKSASHHILSNSDHFLINILNEEQEEYSRKFASKANIDKWENTEHFESKITKNKVLKDVIFYIECEKYAIYPGGDHSIFVGKLIHMEKMSDKKPLIYYKGKYCNLK